MVDIRPGRADEAGAISALAIASKAHWGYAEDQMQVFRGELTLTEDDILAAHVHVAEGGGELAGFYSLRSRSAGEVELEHLFVEPGRLGRGVGSRLYEHALGRARALGARRVIIQSDPHAEGFYHVMGAKLVRRVPSSIPGRTIPFFEVDLRV